MKRILVVEDDAAIRCGLEDNLRFEQYEVRTAETGPEGIGLARDWGPDLLILDIMLPGMTGYEVCRTLRREGSSVLIILLTGRDSEFDRVMGLDMGADDYMTKPFSILELMARIRALARRTEPKDEEVSRLALGDLQIDFGRYEAARGDERIPLTRKEFGLLRCLAAHHGEAVTRRTLLGEVWGYDNLPETRTVDNHVASLRHKIERSPSSPTHVLTVHGVGYRLAG